MDKDKYLATMLCVTILFIFAKHSYLQNIQNSKALKMFLNIRHSGIGYTNFAMRTERCFYEGGPPLQGPPSAASV